MSELPNRRLCRRYKFYHQNFRYFGTIGINPDSLQPCEVFLQAAKSGTDVEAVARDAAVLASIALQHGATIPELRSAMTQLEGGVPAGPVAKLFDLFTEEMKVAA